MQNHRITLAVLSYPARLVCLTVKHPYTNALYVRLPTVLRVPLQASVTLLGGDHPSQTTHHAMSPATGIRL